MLKVKIYKISNVEVEGKEIGHFYIPTGVSMSWLKRNVPLLIRGAQVMGDDLPESELRRPTIFEEEA